MDYQKKFESEYKHLNSEQKEAVEEIEGPVMVIAGPGTGKTQILAMRVANILKRVQANPSNILALTFTNSGVYQIKKRLLEIIGPESYNVHVHTFHSFCNEIINNFPDKFILAKELNQLTDLEQILLIQDILNKSDIKYLKPLKSPFYYDHAIIKAIGDLKQEGVTPADFKKVISEDFSDLKIKTKEGKTTKIALENLQKQIQKNRELQKIYQKYQTHLENHGRYDFSDMILFVLNAFKNDQEILSYYQEQFQYILVDEYQDTNNAQNEIVELLGGFHASPNIFVVGDDEQSIFRFQGASIENILFFSEHHPDTKIIVLKDNYRSAQKILDASRNLISQNKNQIFDRLKVSKKLSSKLNTKGEIQIGEFSSGAVENFFVAKEIQKLIKNGLSPSEITVLYKEHRDADELIDILSRLNIPYVIEAGDDIFEDPEINKIIKMIGVIENLNDDMGLFEIMHYLFFKIPALDVYRITNAAGKNKTHIFDFITSEKINEVKLSKAKNIKQLTQLLLNLRALANNNTFASFFDKVINETGYLEYLLKLEDAVHHLNRLQSLFSEIKKLNVRNKNLNLKGFLEYLLALNENQIKIKEQSLDSDYEGVHLMTAHKAKGLEFTAVFIIHLSDKHWGNTTKRELIKLPTRLIKYPTAADENDEEERRLFYVAMTRAKKLVYLSSATSYGEILDGTLAIPSKFVTELPSTFLTIDSKKYETQFESRLRLSFDKKKWTHTQALKDFLDSLIENFILSATSFNAYLECPYSFLLNQLLRVPKVKDFNQCYGTAVHTALEKFFKKYRQELKLPPKHFLVGAYLEALKLEILSSDDLRRAESQGSKVLEKYYDFYKESFRKIGPPIHCEYNFRHHDVHFSQIPISGIIDKIELIDGISNRVKIVDYKTSAPKSLNQLLGQTKENRLDELYQAFFYKLLSENDPLFKWQITTVEFDFLHPKNNKFYKTAVPIDQREYQKFKELVIKTYGQIIKHDFPKNKKSCRKYNSRCEYFELCE
jgi:DNA helicase-2/ATP-dependent DNA helicase PcrA